MRIFFAVLIIFLSFSANSAPLGRYNNSKTYLMNQQLQYYRANALKRQAAYNYYSNPTRNIRYPNRYSGYPNIERTHYRGISAQDRYSPRYYNQL